ncbi:hypothetical protein FJZ31_27720 [Candidatus Poribacteria bacterium]|nr:hypothetical protein [Candidatus Poribacteria bacterium]
MRKLLFTKQLGIFLLCVLGLLIISSISQSQTSTPFGYLEVNVSDASTLKPLAGAKVFVILENKLVAKAETPTSGIVTFGPLASSSFYKVVAYKKGYKLKSMFPVLVPTDYLTNKIFMPLVPK